MITATLRIPLSPQRLEQTLRGLRALVGPASVARGCRSCRLYQEVGESPSLLLYQQWESQQALEGFLGSEDCRRLLGLLEAAEAAPEVRFETISRSQGLELVASIRQAQSFGS